MFSETFKISNVEFLNSPEVNTFVKKVLTGDELIRNIFDMIPVGISICTDLSCKVIRNNAKAASFFKTEAWSIFSPTNATNASIKILQDGRELSRREMPIQRAMWFGEKLDGEEIEVVLADKSRKFGLVKACPLKDKNGITIGAISICEDITERKRLEAKVEAELVKRKKTHQALFDAVKNLQESNVRFEAFMNAAPVLASVMDRNGHYLYVNKTCQEYFGLQREAFIGKTIYDFEPLILADKIRQNTQMAVQTGQPVENIEETVNLGGKHHYWKSSKFSFRNALGQQLIGAIAFDITEQKQMEQEILELNNSLEIKVNERTEKLQEINDKLKAEIKERKKIEEAFMNSELRYQEFFEQMPIGIAYMRVLVDEKGDFIDNEYLAVNRAYEIDYGKNLIGKRAKDVFPCIEDDAEKFAKVGLIGEKIPPIERYFKRPKKWFKRTAYNIAKEKFIILSEDITAHKKYEEELARLERLNLVGEMAASIGHEVRNPMTTVRGYLQMFQRKEKFSEYQEQFNTMITELDRANLIITEFLSMAKNKSIDLKPGSLNNTIYALHPLMQAEALCMGHTLLMEITEELPLICYDHKEMRQLILNLVQNGLEAMNSAGNLTIKTYLENQNVILAIQDNGSGISEEVLNNLGKPFLTTKEKGTGLGLSICYRIAERHKAKIEVESSSEGTIFYIQFPIEKF